MDYSLSVFVDEPVLYDIRSEKLYDCCNKGALLTLRNLNHQIRREVNDYLFSKYTFEKINDCEYEVQNKFLTFYFISSLYSLYENAYDWIEKPIKKENEPLEDDELLYLSLLDKKINSNEQICNKIRLFKKEIFNSFINNLFIVKLFNVIFPKSIYVYSVKNSVINIDLRSEKILKEKKLSHYFYLYHALVNNVSEKKFIKEEKREKNRRYCSSFFAYPPAYFPEFFQY